MGYVEIKEVAFVVADESVGLEAQKLPFFQVRVPFSKNFFAIEVRKMPLFAPERTLLSEGSVMQPVRDYPGLGELLAKVLWDHWAVDKVV